MKAYASFDKYLADQKPKHRAIVRALRRFVKRTSPEVTEAVKVSDIDERAYAALLRQAVRRA